MAIDRVREHLKKWGRDADILEFATSSATVEMASQALGVEPGKIAKTLSFKTDTGAMLIVAAGDTRIDNSKFKGEFNCKAKMLTPEEALEYTGHAVGGVCPFGVPDAVAVYTDVSMKRYEHIYPACGSSNSAIKLTCEELFEYAGCDKWVDVCKDWQ
jgi:prolyl-tRNA editing enzyme YbaK/EbsC (Cys-tRNA(Pro) deacylase)